MKIEDIKLKPGQRAEVTSRDGENIGSSYMHRVMISVYIHQDSPTGDMYRGRKDYRGHKTPYWIANFGPFACHYKTGLSKFDEGRYNAQFEKAKEIANQINKNNGL